MEDFNWWHFGAAAVGTFAACIAVTRLIRSRAGRRKASQRLEAPAPGSSQAIALRHLSKDTKVIEVAAAAAANHFAGGGFTIPASSQASAISEIQAAIVKLTELRNASPKGRWFWDVPAGDWTHGNGSLLATDETWRVCRHYCDFDPSASITHRGTPRVSNGHEHLNCKVVLEGWGYDASGIEGTDNDRELIVTLHRTIDAQLAILNDAFASRLVYYPNSGAGEAAWTVSNGAAMNLARAINGTLESKSST